MIHATSLPSCVELFLHFLSEENAKIGIFTLHGKRSFLPAELGWPDSFTDVLTS